MVTLEQLEALRRESLADAGTEDAAELQSVRITGESAAERLESLLEQVGNPYRCRVGDTVVRFSFSPDGEPMEERLKRYLLSLKEG